MFNCVTCNIRTTCWTKCEFLHLFNWNLFIIGSLYQNLFIVTFFRNIYSLVLSHPVMLMFGWFWTTVIRWLWRTRIIANAVWRFRRTCIVLVWTCIRSRSCVVLLWFWSIWLIRRICFSSFFFLFFLAWWLIYIYRFIFSWLFSSYFFLCLYYCLNFMWKRIYKF